MRFSDEDTIFITGATSGFGLAIAKRFAKETSARLILLARRQERLEAIAKELGRECHLICQDIRDRAALETNIAAIPERFGKIAALTNNAGLALGTEPADQARIDEWETMIDTNCRALVTLTRLVLPGMLARNRGHIVNIGSTAGSWAYPGANVYGASKAFVKQFSANLRADIAGRPVRVTNIEPGAALTEFSIVRMRGDNTKADAVYQGMTPLSADDIAEAVYWSVSMPEHMNVTAMEIMATAQAPAGLMMRRE
ncbi:MAG: SDR family NAD(P)-dependent oxidoreductase [Planctomycetes bacterium]|nr:SDR family NAD(P)-dependent oxidoreductase [Planctomycetota bacterium]